MPTSAMKVRQQRSLVVQLCASTQLLLSLQSARHDVCPCIDMFWWCCAQLVTRVLHVRLITAAQKVCTHWAGRHTSVADSETLHDALSNAEMCAMQRSAQLPTLLLMT